MKYILLISLVSLLMSCRKDIGEVTQDEQYINLVRKNLCDSVSREDYQDIEFKKMVKVAYETGETFVRIGFKNKEMSEQFVLLQTDEKGNIKRGRIVVLTINIQDERSVYSYNGGIVITSLDRRKEILNSAIVNGYFTNDRNFLRQQRTYVVPSSKPSGLPEVIVTCYISASKAISYSDWISLTSLMGYGNNGNSGFYSPIGSNSGGGGGGGSNGGSVGNTYNNGSENERFDYRSNPLHHETPMLVDFEPVEDLTPIDIRKYIKCFASVPDAGAQCSIEILTDIPVDSDPNKLLNWRTGSPGHTFLQIKKSNGSKSVMQNIGFYPVNGWKTTLTPAPIEGKFVDNGSHEFNAGLSMNITPEQLKSVLVHIESLARFIKYDIDEFNCTDFALDVFNLSRVSNPVEIPKYQIPGGMAINGTSTPQGLYNQLAKMRQAGVEASNINIPGVKGWVSDSKGPCE